MRFFVTLIIVSRLKMYCMYNVITSCYDIGYTIDFNQSKKEERKNT